MFLMIDTEEEKQEKELCKKRFKLWIENKTFPFIFVIKDLFQVKVGDRVYLKNSDSALILAIIPAQPVNTGIHKEVVYQVCIKPIYEPETKIAHLHRQDFMTPYEVANDFLLQQNNPEIMKLPPEEIIQHIENWVL